MIIGIKDFLSINDKLVIDMRTNEEYQAGHIVDAVNFEILNYEERKKVSLLYNKGLNGEAYLLAYEYALEKLPRLFSIIKEHKDEKIVLYCARGGSRSTIAYEVFKSLKAIEIYKIKGGYKSYRQYTNKFFNEELNGYKVLKIYENVGINYSRQWLRNDKYLLLDLREKIKPKENPFILLKPNEEYLNNRMLNYYIFNYLYYSSLKRVVFLLPATRNFSNVLHEKLSLLMDSCEGLYLSENIEHRIKKIEGSYFQGDFRLGVLIDYLSNKRKIMSNAIVDEIIQAFNGKNFQRAIELILLNYIDPRQNHFTKKNGIQQISSKKEMNKYLESWSE